MKIRQGFVSNSSSSSFVVSRDKLSEDQLEMMILYHRFQNEDGWSMHFTADGVHGFTIMDNGSLSEFFKKINVVGVVWDYD